MASNLEFVQYVCDQMSGAGAIAYRKMFGEYALYCDGKVVALVCDNLLYVKKTEAGAQLLPGREEAAPYEGAKPHLLLEELEDRELLARFIRATCDELPAPKPKKRKKDKKEGVL